MRNGTFIWEMFLVLFGSVFLLVAKKLQKRALERGVESGSKKDDFWIPRTLWGVLAPARQLNSNFFVLDPPSTTCGVILGSNWSQKSPLYSFGVTSGPFGESKVEVKFCGLAAVGRRGGP